MSSGGKTSVRPIKGGLPCRATNGLCIYYTIHHNYTGACVPIRYVQFGSDDSTCNSLDSRLLGNQPRKADITHFYKSHKEPSPQCEAARECFSSYSSRAYTPASVLPHFEPPHRPLLTAHLDQVPRHHQVAGLEALGPWPSKRKMSRVHANFHFDRAVHTTISLYVADHVASSAALSPWGAESATAHEGVSISAAGSLRRTTTQGPRQGAFRSWGR